MIPYITSHAHILLLALIVVNQFLADIPALKGNTLFTLYRGFVKDEAAKVDPTLANVDKN